MIVDDKMIPYDRPFRVPASRNIAPPVLPPAAAQPVRPDDPRRDKRREQHGDPSGTKNSSCEETPAGPILRQIPVSEERYAELLEKEEKLRRLEDMLERVFGFSVQGMREGRILYAARVSRRETERLLWELVRRPPSTLNNLAPVPGRHPELGLERVEVED